MTREKILKKLDSFAVHYHHGQRAPHKALLLLLALGRIHQGEQERLLPYCEWAVDLTRLLMKYWNSRAGRRQAPHDPYCLLCQTDKLWEIPGYDDLPFGGNGRPVPASLYGTVGGFPKCIYSAFCEDAQLVAEAATLLLQRKTSLPEDLYAEVLRDAGLRGVMLTTLPELPEQFRLPGEFHTAVLQAYGNCCAICNYDLRVDDAPLGLEAAHIRPVDADGPDEVSNGLALCPVHHKGLAAGGISLSDEYELLVSSHLQGGTPDFWFKPYANKPIAMPIGSKNIPHLDHINWHRAQVWRG